MTRGNPRRDQASQEGAIYDEVSYEDHNHPPFEQGGTYCNTARHETQNSKHSPDTHANSEKLKIFDR